MNSKLNKDLLSNEIYKINYQGKTIYYSPLTRNFNIIDGKIDEEWLDLVTNENEIPDFIKEKSFSDGKNKVKIRLNVTSKCNLSCSYCSVNAESKQGLNMDESLALKTIDELFKYSLENKAKEIELTFSGGEPTLRSNLIKNIINYADEKIKGTDIKLITKLLTNGIIPKEKITDLSKLFNGIQISWDGFLINNPRFGDKNYIHNVIWENIGEFVKNGVKVNILIVVSEYNYLYLEKIVDEIVNTFGIEDIVLSLKDNVGRGEENILMDYNIIKEKYLSLWKKYRSIDIDIPLTGTDIHSISNHPCGISVPNFSIGPKGDISACTLAFNYTNSNINEEYNIGDISDKGIIFKESQITKLQAIDIISMKECSKCYAKWHCRGGCRYANKGEWLGNIAPNRCNMIRDIIAEKILFLAGI